MAHILVMECRLVAHGVLGTSEGAIEAISDLEE